jgi:DNA-binding PucR family transcriptional regulator
VDTLRAYLEAFGDVRRAAEVVAVHPNTFRYRIRRVGELSGIRLDDPTDRFIAELQLRLLDGM